MDWPYWRGPLGNGISYETGLVDTWDPDGENLIWKREDLGTRSTPIVMNGKLYMLARKDPGTVTEAERVLCVNPETGDVIWEYVFNVYLSDVPDTRVAWSCVVGDPETGNVYAHGVCGYFCCLNGETGEVIWDHSMHEEFGVISTYGGRTNKPIIFEDLVLASGVTTSWGGYAVPAHRFLAFNKNTGEVVWFKGTRFNPYDTTYSSPAIAMLDGQAALVFGSGDGGVWALQPRTGEQIWHYDLARRGLNVAPLVVGDTVYANHGEENVDDNTMGAMVAINGALSGDVTQSGELWRVKELVAGRSSPLLIDGKLYVIDDKAGLWILDPETGKQIVYDADGQAMEGDGRRANKKLGSAMFSNPLYADGKIYCITANGRWYILKPTNETKEGVEVLQQARLGGDCNASPIVSHGRLFIPTSECLYCVGQPNQSPQANPLPEMPAETPGDDTPAHLQLVPYETLIQPGETVQFQARLFNSKGQLLDEQAVEYTVEGPATINASGEMTANAEAAHEAAFITAKFGDLQGEARVRIVPPLPWSFDFENGEIPITWVGMRNRHIVEQIDGNNVAFKRDVIPTPRGDTKLGTRSQGWMGPIDLKDYTVQADVMAVEQGGWLPIMGITAQRYGMELMGREGQLRISTWAAQLRMATTIPFESKPNVWYTMKLTATTEDGKAVLRGKVWPRDEAEPEEWTITAEDPSPNTHGAPGFVANTQYAPFYMDNVKVYANE